MTDLNQFLLDLGLNEKEVKLYLCSLQLGSQSASVISKRVGMPRSTVSFIFEELIKKGFSTRETKGNTRYYYVLPPENLEYVLMEKMAAVKKSMGDYKSLLPAFDALRNKFSATPRVRYFEGYKGLCRMLDDFCTKDETVLYISGHNMMHLKIRDYVFDVYMPISDKHQNKNKIILNDGEKAREYEKLAANAYDEFIFVDEKDHAFTLTTAIYGNKTAFWSYDPKDMTGIIVENQLIADNMRTVFEIMRKIFGRQ